jgi:multiple sugar transport system substrate-binding protein
LLFEAEHPGIVLEEQTVGWPDYWPLLGTMAAGGDLPDIIQMDWAFLEEYVGNGQLLELTPFIDAGIIDLSDVPEAVIETGRVGTGIYAISIGMNGASMIYNQTLLDELGLTVEDNMSIDAFVEIARTVYAETGIRTNIPFTDPSNPLESMLRERGVTMLTPEGMGGTYEDYIPFFELVEMGIEEGWHISPETMVGRDGMEMDPLIMEAEPSERSWMGFYFSNMLSGLQAAMDDAQEGVVLGITTYPSDNPQLSNYIRASMYFSISAGTAHAEEAATFVNFWTNSVAANEILLGERGIPASQVVSDAIIPLTGEVGEKMSDFVAMVADYSSPVNPPRPEGAGDIVDFLRLMIERLTHGEVTAAEAAEEFFDYGNSILR